MNRILALLLVSIAGLNALGAGISPELTAFKEGAVLLVEGIANQNRSSLTDAAEIFSEIDYSEFDDFETAESAPGSLSDPEIIFNADFCNDVRKRNFSLVKLNPLEGLRNLDGDISTITRSLAPGASASFTMEGIDDMGLVAVAQYPDAIEVTLEYKGSKIPLAKDASSYACMAGWTISDDSPEFKVTVGNTSDKPVTFVLGIQ